MSTTQTPSMAAAQAAFVPSETLCDLFLRKYLPAIEYTFLNSENRTKVEPLAFGTMCELQVPSASASTHRVYELIHTFFEHKQASFVVHMSTCDNFSSHLHQSGFDITTLPLALVEASHQGRFKTVSVLHLQQVLAVIELLSVSLDGAPCLVIMELLTPLFVACKTGTMMVTPHHSMQQGGGGIASGNSNALAASTLQAMKKLVETQNVILVVITHKTASSSKGGGGGSLREGHPKDPLTQLWKERMKRVIYT